MALNDHALCTFASLAPSLLLETLWVQQWQGEEQLSQPYRFEVRLATINPLFDDEALLGNRAVLTLSDALGQPHPYQGVVTEVASLAVKMLGTVMQHPPERDPSQTGMAPQISGALEFDQVTFRSRAR